MKTFTAKPARALALAAVTVLGLSGISHADGYRGLIQTIKVSSSKGVSDMHQVFQPGTVRPHATRICLVNLSTSTKTMTHAVKGQGPMRAAPGRTACGHFNASRRLGFGLLDGQEPARPSVAMVMSLGAFAGGTVNFMWE